MFQGPKGYIAQICEVQQQNGLFTLFSSKFHSNIYSILFDENLKLVKHDDLKGESRLLPLISYFYGLLNDLAKESSFYLELISHISDNR